MPPDYEAQLLRVLRSLVSHVDDLSIALHQYSDTVRENIQAQQEATKKEKTQTELGGAVAVELNKSVAVTLQGEPKATIKNSWDGRDWLRLGAELVGLGVLIWYACTTRNLWKESHEQTGHMRTQLELSQRAVLVVGDPTPKFNARQVKFPVTNAGFASGTVRSIRVDYGIARGSTAVLAFHGIDNVPDVEHVSHETRTYAFLVNLPKLPDAVAKAIAAGEEIETMLGTLTYDDGFGNTAMVPFCATHDIKLKLWASDECLLGPTVTVQ